MKTYELALILVPTLTEEETLSFVSKLSGVVTSEGTTLEKSEIKAAEPLSYPIKHHNQGHRIFVEIKTEDGNALNDNVQKMLLHEEKVLRHSLLLKPKAAPVRVEQQPSVLTELRREKRAASRSGASRPAAVQAHEVDTPHEKADTQEIDKKIEELLK